MFELHEMDRDELNKRFDARCEMAVNAERELHKNDVYGEVSPLMHGHKDICVEIRWGDWKHDHLFCDYILQGMGFTLVNVDETETDGSDCYSALRYYRKAVA